MEQRNIAAVNLDSAIAAAQRAEVEAERARAQRMIAEQIMAELQEALEALKRCK